MKKRIVKTEVIPGFNYILLVTYRVSFFSVELPFNLYVSGIIDREFTQEGLEELSNKLLGI